MDRKPLKVECPELNQDTKPSIQFDWGMQDGDFCCKEEVKNENDHGHNSGMCDDEMTTRATFNNMKTEPYIHVNIDCTKETPDMGEIKQEPSESLEAVGDGDLSLSDPAMDNSPVPVSLYPHLATSTRNVQIDDGVKSDPEAMLRCDQKGVTLGAAEISNLNVERKHPALFTQNLDRRNLLKCTFCVYRTTAEANLVQHMKTHIGEKPYTCHRCDYRCAQLSDMKIHKRTHSPEKRYSCLYCNFWCELPSALKLHERKHTGEKPYKCFICSYTTSYKGQVTIHELTHTGEKPYKCSICSFTASRQHKITKHERTHSGEKPYKCSICSYTSSRQYNITLHERTHSSEKPYKCSHCAHTASQKGAIIVHERTHTGEKPYKCSICPYTASRQYSIMIHEQTHTGEKSYRCSYNPSSIKRTGLEKRTCEPE